MGIETALLATLVLGAGVSAYQAKKSADFSKDQANKQEAATKKLAADEEKNKLQTMMRMQKKKGAVGEPGMRDTILTSPLGVPGQPATAQKTLLGL